jgi:fructose-specific component phosphotransferase system IIB-like protein
MGRIVKVLSLVLVSLVLVFGTGIEADAKKKKKKVVLTAEETAMFDKWEVKPKKTGQGGQGHAEET